MRGLGLSNSRNARSFLYILNPSSSVELSLRVTEILSMMFVEQETMVGEAGGAAVGMGVGGTGVEVGGMGVEVGMGVAVGGKGSGVIKAPGPEVKEGRLKARRLIPKKAEVMRAMTIKERRMRRPMRAEVNLFLA